MAADYKVKYLDLRTKFLEASDVAYRLGFEEGMKEGEQAAQEQAMMEQQAQEQAMMQGGMGGMPPGAEGEEGGMPPEQMMGEEGDMDMAAPASGGGDAEMSEGESSELDSHINELEGLVQKGEKPSVLNMRKAVEKISTLRKSQKDVKNKGVKTSTAQKRVVNKILKKWEDESKDVTDGLEDILKTHGIKLED